MQELIMETFVCVVITKSYVEWKKTPCVFCLRSFCDIFVSFL